MSLEQVHGALVQRVLRHGDHDGVLRVLDAQLKSHLHSRTGSVGEEDLLRGRRDAVAAFDEVGNALAHGEETLRFTVSTGAPGDLTKEFLGAADDVRGEQRGDGFLLQQFRVVQKREDLAHESDGLLPDALRVSDVCEHHFLERELEAVAGGDACSNETE